MANPLFRQENNMKKSTTGTRGSTAEQMAGLSNLTKAGFTSLPMNHHRTSTNGQWPSWRPSPRFRLLPEGRRATREAVENDSRAPIARDGRPRPKASSPAREVAQARAAIGKTINGVIENRLQVRRASQSGAPEAVELPPPRPPSKSQAQSQSCAPSAKNERDVENRASERAHSLTGPAARVDHDRT